MTNQELIAALRRNMVETGSLICLGCGHEHGCSTQGCAILREAADRLEQLSAGQSPNPPLTLEELRGMDGEPVYIVFDDGSMTCDLVDACHAGLKLTNHWGVQIVLDAYKAYMKAIYRRKPEEEGDMNKYCERCYLRDAKPCAECSYCFPGHKNFRPAPASKNNADRFRSMTNEELAVTLPCPNEMGMAEIACDHGDDSDCCACLLAWLNRPEEDTKWQL